MNSRPVHVRLKGRQRCHDYLRFAALLTVALALIGLLPREAETQPRVQKSGETACLSTVEASDHVNGDICMNAHVFAVVDLPDGTRFLDVCPPSTPDQDCRFTIMSKREDRGDVGDLRRLRDRDVQVRGIVHSMNGRMGIVLSHVRQFSGGPEKFRPNPKLLRGFSAQSDRPPVRDPNLSGSGSHRAFMDERQTEPLKR